MGFHLFHSKSVSLLRLWVNLSLSTAQDLRVFNTDAYTKDQGSTGLLSVSLILSWLTPLIPSLGLFMSETVSHHAVEGRKCSYFPGLLTHALSLSQERGDGMLSSHTEGQSKKQDGPQKDPSNSHLAYGILDRPPWYLCIFLGIQVSPPSQY